MKRDRVEGVGINLYQHGVLNKGLPRDYAPRVERMEIHT